MSERVRTVPEQSGQTATCSVEGTCNECGGDVTASPRGVRACEECGLLVEDAPIDHQREWRNFKDRDDQPRGVGAPTTVTRHDNGLTTEIGWAPKDANGNALSAKKRRQMGRLRMRHKRTQRDSKHERNQSFGLMEIGRMVSALGLDDTIKQNACRLFREMHDAGEAQGRCLESLAAASVYAAGRIHQRPLKLDDVATVARVDYQRIAKMYRTMNTEMGLPVPPRPPETFVPSIVSDLGVTGPVEQTAVRLLEKADESELPEGADPSGIAAGAVWWAIKAHDQKLCVTQAQIADAAGVCIVTIRTNRGRIEEAIIAAGHDDIERLNANATTRPCPDCDADSEFAQPELKHHLVEEHHRSTPYANAVVKGVFGDE